MISTKINGRYRIDSELGQGGMGTVYKGFDIILDREVAIKMMAETNLGTDGRSRILREAKAIAHLSHPNIITVHDVGECNGSPFIVMEYIEGVNLYQQPPKDIEKIILVGKQICAALAHAHEHGIIHRDLKPENVILTSEGIAKLSDFGLARQVSSRMTKEGMISGSVYYLAPEQIQKQVADPRSDLYSLGVLMYELTTGELPFMADDPLAIISQHIHAPVVPPRAKNDHIPPALEALILDLLKKDPDDRPASAREVLDRLSAPEILDMETLPAEEHSLLDRIVRGRLVGREQELSMARQAWQHAMGGEGGLLLISGGPGVGKTRLVKEIATQAEASGGQAYIGESQAEGNAPYAAIAQIIRRALRAHPNTVLNLPNLVLPEIMTVVPELTIKYPDLPPNASLEPESEQRRLFECIIAFFSTLCQQKPLLLIMEDLHWADSGTLSLLQFMAGRCREHPVFLVGTYRDVEVDEALPFYQTLLNLERRKQGLQLKLESLDKYKTRDMLANIFAEEITPEFLDGIYIKTEGNPFFIEEICKALIESGQVYFDGKRWQRPPDMADMDIPQSIKITIQSRVGKLKRPAQQSLMHAAMIGREFEFDLLRKLTAEPENDLIDCLEAAIKSQMIEEIKEEGSERFSFSHALIPETLRESLSAVRRTRLHRKVALLIEETSPEEYQRLAYHWGEGGNQEKRLDYTLKAADNAKQTYANQDAIQLYGEALDLIPENDPKRFDLLQKRADVLKLVGDRNAELEDRETMLQIAVSLKDLRLTCIAQLSLADYYSIDFYSRTLEIIDSALEICRSLEEPVLEAQALTIKGFIFNYVDKQQKSIDSLNAACQLLIPLNLPAKMAKCQDLLSLSYGHIGKVQASTEAAQQCLELSRKINDRQQEMIALRRVGGALWVAGEIEEAIRITEQSRRIAEEIGDKQGEITALLNNGMHFRNKGKLEEAESNYLLAFKLSEELGLYPRALIQNYLAVVWQLGNYEAALNLYKTGMDRGRLEGNDGIVLSMSRGVEEILFQLGQYQRLDSMLDGQYLEDIENIRGPDDKVGTIGLKGKCQFLLSRQESGLNLISSAIKESSTMGNALLNYLLTMELVFIKSFLEDPAEWEQALRIANTAVLPPLQQINVRTYNAKKFLALSRLYLKLDRVGEAKNFSKNLMDLIERNSAQGYLELSYFTHATILRAAGDEGQADDYLKKAYNRVMLVAGKTKDDELRRGWLKNVPWNQEILQEAKNRGIALE